MQNKSKMNTVTEDNSVFARFMRNARAFVARAVAEGAATNDIPRHSSERQFMALTKPAHKYRAPSWVDSPKARQRGNHSSTVVRWSKQASLNRKTLH